MSEYVTALKKVRGLGSAKSGVHHWIAQRFTAILNIILTIWLFCVLGQVTEMDYNTALNYMGQSCNAIFGLLFITSSFYHAKLGLQIVIEDYIHCKCIKIGALIAMNTIVYTAIAAGLFWTLKISL
jgi:succinate dehydrogenase / fumarate reductase membrane anchor subunit